MLDFLKTMPDMTNATEAVVPAPKTFSISQRIADYKAANPDASVKEIAEAVGTSKPYVYQVLGPSAKKQKKPKEKKPEVLLAAKSKTDGFAVGVTQPHYWVISALASGRKTTRTAVLQGIIDQYIRDVLTEANPNGTSV
jgi:hypothetical protein